MGLGVRRHSMEEHFIDKTEMAPKPVKSLMWYVGYIIAIGVIGVAAVLLLMEVVSIQ